MGRKANNEELTVKLEVRVGNEVKRETWRRYARAYPPLSEIFSVLKAEIERTLPFLKKR